MTQGPTYLSAQNYDLAKDAGMDMSNYRRSDPLVPMAPSDMLDRWTEIEVGELDRLPQPSLARRFWNWLWERS